MTDSVEEKKVRIHKWLSGQGICSRRDAEKMLIDGDIKINGEVITKLGTSIVPGKDRVEVKGELIENSPPDFCYFILNKPVGYLTTVRDAHGRDTIFDLPVFKGLEQRIFPVGRLDRQTSGLLLLTNNGSLAQRIMHPSFSVPKTYHVRVKESINPKHLDLKKAELEDGELAILEIRQLNASPYSALDGNWLEVSISVGRNRVVRRLMKHWGYSLLELLRAKLGTVELDTDSKPGDLYPLDSKEAESIMG